VGFGAKLLGWVFALTVVGYPVAGLLAVFFDMPSWGASYPFRVLILLLSGLLLGIAIRSQQTTPASRLMLFFWCLYAVRLAWDGVFGPPGAFAALLFFVVTIVIPVASSTLAARFWDERVAASAVFLTGSVVCVFGALLGTGVLATDRMYADVTTRLFLDTVNPISFGHTGASTIIAAIVLGSYQLSAFRLITLLAGVVAAVACIVVSASRGPMVALFAVAFFLAIARGRMMLLVVLVALSMGAIYLGFELEVLSRFQGIVGADQDASALERLVLQSRALTMFLEHPIFGAAYAEWESNEYPHNLFIETAMALGIAGLIPVIALVFAAYASSWRQVKAGYLLLPLFFVQNFFAFQFSSALWGASAFWISISLVIAVQIGQRNLSGARVAHQKKRS